MLDLGSAKGGVKSMGGWNGWKYGGEITRSPKERIVFGLDKPKVRELGDRTDDAVHSVGTRNTWPDSAAKPTSVASSVLRCNPLSLSGIVRDGPTRAAALALWGLSKASCAASSCFEELSFAWTVCLCWRRLSRRENRLEQCKHANGLSPVCFRLWRARCSDRVKDLVQLGKPVHRNTRALLLFLDLGSVGIAAEVAISLELRVPPGDSLS